MMLIAGETSAPPPSVARENVVLSPSAGNGKEASVIDRTLRDLVVRSSTKDWRVPDDVTDSALAARIKIIREISQFAMHLPSAWITSLHVQLSDLLDLDWDSDEPLPSLGSVRTFLRMVTHLPFASCPGLGFGNGNLVAAWTAEHYRLTIECQFFDRIRWAFSHPLETMIEVGSGITTVKRLPDVLSPYRMTPWVLDGQEKAR